jgi:hypothetical protein
MKKKKEEKKPRFNIDFYEFSFLVEACIPPRPIARAMFWDRVIDVYFFEMTENERQRLFEWINRNCYFQENVKKREEDCMWFYNRFNPDNQYIITSDFNGEIETNQCFLHKNRNEIEHYYIKKNVFVSEEFITKKEKHEFCETR